MIPPDLERLQRLLGGTALAPLRQRLRERYARGLSIEVFTLTGLEPDARQALEGLLGRGPRQGKSIRLSLAELDTAMSRAGLARDFRTALEALDGPIEDRPAARLAKARAWDSAFSWVTEYRLRALLSSAKGSGLVKRLAGSDPTTAAHLLGQAEALLRRLPAAGLPLAKLAAEVTGDAHALDEGRALSSLVLAAVATETAIGEDPEQGRARNRWASLGVSVNELSAPVLILNLPATGASHGAQVCEMAGLQGEPVHFSLRTLLREAPSWSVSGKDVFVCENPTVVTLAADALGADCSSLVCTDGMPSASQRTLLYQLARAGAALHYHGDFDWAGLHIGNWMLRTLGARPWRFATADYQSHCTRSQRRLQGKPVQALWDTSLAAAMLRSGLALEEETMAEHLLPDLAG